MEQIQRKEENSPHHSESSRKLQLPTLPTNLEIGMDEIFHKEDSRQDAKDSNSSEEVYRRQLPCRDDVESENQQTSCPSMPSWEGDEEEDSPIQLEIRRCPAWSQDSGDHRSKRVRRQSIEVVRKYGRADSMLIDSTEAELVESPTSTWVYWEEQLDSSSPIQNFSPTRND